MNTYRLSAIAAAISLLTAAGAQAAPRDLADIMKDMSESWKIVGAQISDPSQNTATIAAAEKLRGFIYEAAGAVPEDKILEQMFPDATKRKLAPIQFQNAIAQLFETAGNLELALMINDNKSAKVEATKLDAIKKLGHNTFKPKEE